MRGHMRIDNPSAERLAAYFSVLDLRAAQSSNTDSFRRVCYLDLGTQIVRLVICSKAFESHIEKQLTYILRDEAPRYDATLIVWQEPHVETLARELEAKGNPHESLRMRLHKLQFGYEPVEINNHLLVYSAAYSDPHPCIDINPWNMVVHAHNPLAKTYYYAVKNLAPEEFIKHGHIFVQTLNKLLKTPSSALVHGAAVGLDGKGILFCARGQRGKSTLAVKSMLDGFDYVSDDYLVLGEEVGNLYAWPIYSIITLSPMMYGDLYATLDAKFVSNNARKDKYVFNIANYHERFVKRYPIALCMFPQIVHDPEPSIVLCTPVGRGRAIVELVHSTISQMGDQHDIETVKKLMGFVRDLPFYQINLCRDIEKNLKCLRNFLQSGECGRQTDVAGLLHSHAQPATTFSY